MPAKKKWKRQPKKQKANLHGFFEGSQMAGMPGAKIDKVETQDLGDGRTVVCVTLKLKKASKMGVMR